jgi:hypothetical protein
MHLAVCIRPLVMGARGVRPVLVAAPPAADAAETSAPSPAAAVTVSAAALADGCLPVAALPAPLAAAAASAAVASAPTTPAAVPSSSTAAADPAGREGGGDKMAQIMAAVQSLPMELPSLSEAQLRAILALSAQTSAVPPSAAAPAPAPAPASSAVQHPPHSMGLALGTPLGKPLLGTPLGTPHEAPPAFGALLAHTPPTVGAAAYTPPVALPANSRKRPVGGASWAPLQVALWDKQKRQRLPSTSYKGDLHAHLLANPHLEVYNRQDVASGGGAQLLAGTRLHTAQLGAESEPRVVLWDGRSHRKLSLSESPIQAGLCSFLKANPHVHVYTGQTPPPLPRSEVASGGRPLAAGSGKLISMSNAKSLLPKGAKKPSALGPANSNNGPTPMASFDKAKPLLPPGMCGGVTHR